jgi:hypothetical protein
MIMHKEDKMFVNTQNNNLITTSLKTQIFYYYHLV